MFIIGPKAFVHIFDDLIKKINNWFNYDNNNNYRCAICLEFISNNNNATTQCNHHFCLTCLLENLEVNNKCPLCRNNITDNKIKLKKITHNTAVNFIKETVEEYNFDSLSQSIRYFDNETSNMLEAIVKFMMMDICNKLIKEQNDTDDDEDDDYF